MVNFGTITGINGIGVDLTAGGSVTNASSGTITGYGDGIAIVGSAGTVANQGTIASLGSFSIGVVLQAGGSVTNGASGSTAALIEGPQDGVALNGISGSVGTVLNYGTIAATNTAGFVRGIVLFAGGNVTNGASGSTAALIEGALYGVQTGLVKHLGGTVVNFGTIAATGTSGIGVYLVAGGAVTNGAAGSTAALISGHQSAINISGGAGTVSNFGTVSAVKTGGTAFVTGIGLRGGGTVTNQAGGLITAYDVGVSNFGTSVTLAVTNYGTIQSTQTRSFVVAPGTTFTGFGVQVGASATGIVNNFGTISSAQTNGGGAILLQDGGSVTNASSGLIEGANSGVSIGNTAGGAGTVVNSGTIEALGSITNSSGSITGGNAVDLNAGGNVQNGAAGLIAGYHIGILVPSSAPSSAVATVTNFGTIEARQTAINGFDGVGVQLDRGGSVANYGLISGQLGILVPTTPGATGTVSNLGTIEATGSFTVSGTVALYPDAVRLDGGGVVTNGQSGTGAGLITAGWVGVEITNAAGTLVNFGTVEGTGTVVSPKGFLSTGVVISTGTVIDGATGATAALITSDAGAAVYMGGIGLVPTASDTGTVSNFGTISNTGNGAVAGHSAIRLAAGGSVLNAGLVESASGDGISIGGTTVGGAGTVTNFGTITSGETGTVGAAVYLGAGGVVTNGASGTAAALISANHTGVSLKNTAGTVFNFGTVVSTAPLSSASGSGVYLGAGGQITNASGATISALRAAVSIGNTFATSAAASIDNLGILTGNTGVAVGAVDTGNNTLTNAGSITGTGGTAVKFGSGNDLLTVDPGAVFIGLVDGGAGNNTLELAAGGATGTLSGLGTSFVDFGAVRVDGGAVWQVSDAASAAPAFVNDGTVLVLNSNTLEFGAVGEDPGNSGVIGVGSSGVAEFQNTVATGQTLNFLDATGTAKLDAAAQFGATIASFAVGDTIDLVNTTATNLAYSGNTVGGTLTVLNNGATVAALTISGSYAPSQFVLTSDGHGGNQITLTPSPPVNVFDFVFTYNDGKDYYDGTVADNGQFGYFVNEVFVFGDGTYDIFNQAGTAPEPSGTVAVTYYSHGGPGQASYTPVLTAAGKPDASNGLGSESDSILGTNGGPYPFSPSTEAAIPTSNLYGFVFNYSDGAAYYFGTVAENSPQYAAIAGSSSPYLTVSDGYYYIFSEGTTAEPSGTVIINGYRDGGNATTYSTVGNGSAGLGSESGSFLVDGTQFNFSPTQEATDPPPVGTTADMILRDAGNGNYEIYDIGGNSILGGYPLGQVGTDWQFAGLGNFSGSDTTDMILRSATTGNFEVYDISNNNITSAASLGQVGLEWQVAGFGNFNGSGTMTDMMLRDTLTGTFELYDISNNSITSANAIGQVGLEWQVAGFGDFNGDGTTDMLLRDTNTGAFEVYDINNSQLTSASSLGQVGNEWQVAGFGDFNGDGTTDMIMRDTLNGVFELYDIISNRVTSAAPIGQVGLEWQVAGFGPINGAGTADMVLRDVNNGALEFYDIANNQLTGAASLGQVGLKWQVGGFAADPPTSSQPIGASNSQIAQVTAGFAAAASTASLFDGTGQEPSSQLFAAPVHSMM